MHSRIFLLECTLSLTFQKPQTIVPHLWERAGLELRIRIGMFNLFFQNIYHRKDVREEQLVNRFLCFLSFDRQL